MLNLSHFSSYSYLKLFCGCKDKPRVCRSKARLLCNVNCICVAPKKTPPYSCSLNAKRNGWKLFTSLRENFQNRISVDGPKFTYRRSFSLKYYSLTDLFSRSFLFDFENMICMHNCRWSSLCKQLLQLWDNVSLSQLNWFEALSVIRLLIMICLN